MEFCRKVSLILPTYNEEKYITECIESLLVTNYPKELLEIIIVDGNSSDRTVEKVKKIMEQYTFIKLINNPKRIAPVSMNLGIAVSSGDYILRIDAHASYAEDYIENCVILLEKTGADNVGGCMKTEPSNNGIVAKSIALALSHKFGVGNSDFRTIKEEKEVDTVPFGAFPRNIFWKVGFYNEILVRNQDIELNSRIKKIGGKIILSPTINCTYYSRGDYKGLWKQNFNNGKWNIFTSFVTANSLSLRHFVPLIFVLSLILSLLTISISPIYGISIFLLIIIAYVFATMIATLNIVKNTNQIAYLIIQPLSFFVLHISYGFGSLIGILSLSAFKKKVNL